MRRFLTILPSLIALCAVLIMAASYVTHKVYDVKDKSWLFSDVYASPPNTITVDFATQTALGSPLVFGGVHSPRLQDQTAWDLLASAGVTVIRQDFWMETELPSNISLSDYQQNKNNVQDPAKWNWSTGWNNINIVNENFQNAKIRGIKVMAILTYAPRWLTYSGTQFGVPRDWSVYEDVVKKLYRIHRPNLDIIEIWNEPTYTHFLDLTRSPYKTRAAAYADIYKHAVTAIRQVDAEVSDNRHIPILAVSTHTPTETAFVDEFLSNKSLPPLEAFSYHNYHMAEPSNAAYRQILAKHQLSDLPVYLTEWNYSFSEGTPSVYQTGLQALPYTATKLIGFLKQGLAGANYFSTTYYDPTKPNSAPSTFAFYGLKSDGKPYLLPQGKTWQLLSKSLSLGAGPSRIWSTEQPSYTEAIGFTNFSDQKGVAAVNSTDTNHTVQISLRHLKVAKNTTINLYLASATQSPTTPLCSQDFTEERIDPAFWINIPPQSVVGITLTPPKLTFTSLLRVLGISTTNNCLIGL